MSQKLTKIRFLLLYGLALGGLLILMAWANYRFVVVDYAQELYSLLVATVFVSVGIWAGLRWSAPAIIEKMAVVPMPTTAIQPAPNPQVLHQFGISPRELDVLILLSKGLSNNEIARPTLRFHQYC